MRSVRQFIRLLIAIACLAAGAVLGALNRQSVAIDLGAFHAVTTLGVALIVALLAGVLIGGLAISASVVLPMRRRLARSEREQRTTAPLLAADATPAPYER